MDLGAVMYPLCQPVWEGSTLLPEGHERQASKAAKKLYQLGAG